MPKLVSKFGENSNGEEKAFNRRRRCQRCCAALLALLVIFVIVILIGAAVEDDRARKRDETGAYYELETVCAATLSRANLTTFPTEATAHSEGGVVAHCGACGSCSNDVDITIYDETRNTLTETSKDCALKSLWGGRRAVNTCFDDEVGFTTDCNDCWTENVMCDQKNCVFTCLKSIMLGESNNRNGKLNPCLLCDERMCGPAFIECSGANRRRCGITSDIQRDDSSELCGKVDGGWMGLVS